MGDGFEVFTAVIAKGVDDSCGAGVSATIVASLLKYVFVPKRCLLIVLNDCDIVPATK